MEPTQALTPKERLVEILHQMAEGLPIPPMYKAIATPLMAQLETSLAQLTDSDVTDMMAKFKGYLYYVEHGND